MPKKIRWVFDPVSSENQFKVKHLMKTTATGYFRKYNLQIETESDDFTAALNIVFTAGIDSIDTNNAQEIHILNPTVFSRQIVINSWCLKVATMKSPEMDVSLWVI